MKKKICTLALAALISVSAVSGGFVYAGEAEETEAAAAAESEESEAAGENTNYVSGTRYAKPVPDMPIYDDETDKFFENSVFIGDSLMVGFQRYCQSKGSGYFGSPLFLAATSFSLLQAVGPVTSSTLHPYYQGEKLSVEDSIAKSGADRAFLFFGMNDLGWTTPDKTVDEYNTLIYRIHEKAPDTKIYIIGATYIYAPAQKPQSGYTNANLRIFNDKMYSYCQNYDYLEFINIGDRLIDSTDGLQYKYTSDKYVHMTTEGYDVWVKVLRAYAKDFMAAEEAAASAEAQETEETQEAEE
ncbi:MAG: SGNH/GDSL hydrolase family protein [Clostridiales bacterium]|nr:SGNH/GDSL hydrolase family protein [Clostridiales bacterium]